MAIDYNRLKSVADRLITDNGQAVQLVAYDYVDHDDSSVDKVARLVIGMGVVSNFNERDSKMFAEIKANDAKLICKLPERPERGGAQAAARGAHRHGWRGGRQHAAHL